MSGGDFAVCGTCDHEMAHAQKLTPNWSLNLASGNLVPGPFPAFQIMLHAEKREI